MEKLKIEDILLPGAKMNVELVDAADPDIVAIFKETRKPFETI